MSTKISVFSKAGVEIMARSNDFGLSMSSDLQFHQTFVNSTFGQYYKEFIEDEENVLNSQVFQIFDVNDTSLHGKKKIITTFCSAAACPKGLLSIIHRPILMYKPEDAQVIFSTLHVSLCFLFIVLQSKSSIFLIGKV